MEVEYSDAQRREAERAWDSIVRVRLENGTPVTPLRDGRPLRKAQYVAEWLENVYGEVS